VRVSELGGADTLLLLLDPSPAFEGQAQRPFQVLVCDGHLGIRVQELEQAADRLCDRVRIAAGERAAECHPALHGVRPALVAKLGHALGQEVAHEPEVVGEQILAHLRHVPARQEAVDAIHERGVVAHLRRERPQQVADALLVLHVHVEVADEHDAAIGPDVVLARG
jgi:hypothetical protein